MLATILKVKGKVTKGNFSHICSYVVMRSSTEMVESNDQLFHEWNKSIEWIEFGPGCSLTER